MSLNLSVDARNARLDSIETTLGTTPHLKIFSGSKPTACADADPTGLLAELTLPSDFWENAANGQKVLKGTWETNAAVGTGTGLSFRLYTVGGACKMQGTVGMGSGDLQLDNTSFVIGQRAVITVFTLTDGNA